MRIAILYECKKITVDCKVNPMWKDEIKFAYNPVRILGYDFYVKKEETRDMIEFIKKMLKKYKQPLMSIHLNGEMLEREEKHIGTKEQIEEIIKKGY